MLEKVLPCCFADSMLFTNLPNKMCDSTTAVDDSLITRIGTVLQWVILLHQSSACLCLFSPQKGKPTIHKQELYHFDALRQISKTLSLSNLVLNKSEFQLFPLGLYLVIRKQISSVTLNRIKETLMIKSQTHFVYYVKAEFWGNVFFLFSDIASERVYVEGKLYH